MGKILAPHPVKLIVGFISKDERLIDMAEGILRKKFGEIDFKSEILDFNHTDYYQNEFGSGLKRKFISFKRLILAKQLAKIKIATNKIEARLSEDAKRTVNIDPGYLDLAKLVLASTKDFTHRIHLEKGIYAEGTLFFEDKTFKSWPWTYPDYRTPEYIGIFNKIREIYSCQCSHHT